jgi:regulatory protein
LAPTDTDAARAALDAAGRLLSRRAFSKSELRNRLAAKGFEEHVVDQTLHRLGELRLVDDQSFAKDWVEERATRKGLGSRRLRAELESKGVPLEHVEEALATDPEEELARAKALAADRLKRLARLPLQKQGGRLFAWLVGRGFEEETAEAAARAVLPPEGWD